MSHEPRPDAGFHPPLVPSPMPRKTDEFDDRTLTLTESRVARQNLAELRDTLGPMTLRFSHGIYRLRVTRRGVGTLIERSTLTACILAAHELNISLVTASATKEAA